MIFHVFMVVWFSLVVQGFVFGFSLVLGLH